MPYTPYAYAGGGGPGRRSPRGRNPMGERGGPSMARNRATPVNVRAMQQFLRAKGYNIAVDGIMGPQTKSAAEDWRGPRKPGVWSSRIKMDDPNRTNKPANATNHRNQPADSPNNNYRPKNAEPKGARTLPKVKGLGNAILNNNAVNPSVYARAMVDSKYGPILGELMREENLIRESGQNALTDIRNWYSNIGMNMRERAQANQVNDARVQRGIDSVLPGFASALGLDNQSAAMGDLATGADIESDYHREIAASQQAFDRSLQGVTQLAGAQALVNTREDFEEDIEGIQGARRDALGARGNEYITAEQDARVLNLNMQQQQAELASMQARDRMAQVQAMLAAQTAPFDSAIKEQQLMQMILGNQATQQEIRQKGRAGKPKPTGWKNPDLNQDELLTNALSSIKLPSGQWRLPMNPSWARVKSYLRTRGLNPNAPAGQQWLSDFANMAGIRLGPRGNPVSRVGGRSRK